MDGEREDTVPPPAAAGGEAGPHGGEVVILTPGDERSKKIGKALASPAAGDILHALEKGPATAGDLSSSLGMPLGTVKYHIENLLDAGLIEVRHTKYSVKGRQVKVYGLRNQLLIMAPRAHDIRSVLLRYAALFGIVVLSTLAAYAVLSLPRPAGENVLRADTLSPHLEPARGILSVPPGPAGGVPGALPSELALAFFCGGVLVILVLLVYEAWASRTRA
ncbi:MAG: winged helix-turn-helix domain-containing protein [Methanolinea sp.]|nr:winged helix-turn-helix domain-containing protein [Methanolinea sp.]